MTDAEQVAREQRILIHALKDTCKRSKDASGMIATLFMDETIPPVVRLALRHIGNQLLITGSTDLLYGELLKGHPKNWDIIENSQKQGY